MSKAKNSELDESTYGSDACPSGILNLYGARPGSGFSYSRPTMPDMTMMTMTFTTTHEALQHVLVPRPLQVCRDLPPVCTLSAFVNPGCIGFDGRPHPYAGFLFYAPVEWRDKRGTTGREYVGSINGADHTMMADQLIAWSINFGIVKNLADIRFMPDGDGTVITCDRQGKRLITMRVRRKELLAADASPFQGGHEEVLTVREIPTVDFQGYVDRSVCAYPSGQMTTKKVWTAEASVEFGKDDLHPLHLLTVVEYGPSFVSVGDIHPESFKSHYVVEQLPLKPGVPNERSSSVTNEKTVA